ncbi:MAG: PAS domain S-box protein [Bacteroidales bacterium]|jgi:PAS domain S-box-containing protein|nr:PAS domain S-box protein [Bacteroidales bacterium]
MKKILVIDDDLAQITIIKSIINKNFLDFKVFTSLSSQEGLELAHKEIPDTILLDIVMPKMDGYDVCKRLKANKDTKHIPVIMITGVEKSIESRAKGLEMGADAFLYKPFDPLELTSQLKVMLRIKEAEDKLRAEKESLEERIAERTFELKKSEAKFRSLFLFANDSIFLMKGDKFIECNPKTLQLFACKEEEIIGQSPDKFSPKYQPDGSLSSEKAIQKINAAINGKPQFFEWIHTRKDGTTFDAEVSLNKIIISNEEYIQAIVRDFSERKIANRQIQESEKRFKQLFVDLSDAVLVTSIEGDDIGNVLEVNNEAMKQTGYSRSELLRMNIINDLVVPGTGEINTDDWNKKLLKGETVTTTEMMRKKDGSKYWTEVKVKPIVYNGKKASLSINRDITERIRKEKEQRLLYNISNAANLTQRLDELIKFIQVELDKIIDTTNFFIALYDEETDMISLPFFVDEKDNYSVFPAGKTLTKYVIKTKKSLFGTKRIIKKLEETGEVESIGEDSEIWLGVPLKIEDKVIGVLVVQSYNNQYAYAESDLKMLEFISDQFSLSINRSKTLDDLKIALEKATESDHLKSAFLATMSHELRTPLNAIIGFSEMINGELPLEDIVDFNQIIHTSGNQLLHIIEEIFDITLIDAGDVEIIKEEVELKVILDKVKEIVKIDQHRMQKDNLILSYINSVDEKEVVINTDPSKLKQILINLVKNALKFTEKGHINYGYSVIKKNGKPVLQFYVEDTGIGISKDNLSIIFNMFRQVEYSNTREYGGVGIGLSIAKKLVELLGGELWVESTLGQGSVFYFTLPDALISNYKTPLIKV